MDTIKNYLLFNPQYNKLNKNQLKLQYKKDVNNDNIIKSFEDFKNKYPDFNFEFYKKVYDLENKNYKDTLIHWINYGMYNNLINNKIEFYTKYKNFDYNDYLKKYNLKSNNEENAIIHFLKVGKYDLYLINKINDSEIKILNNKYYIPCKNSYSKKKIAHLFKHFFKCGGGEIYLKNFIKYSNYENYLLIDFNFCNFIEKNLDINIIYYKNEQELLEIFNDFDVILDHQYYLYKNINNNKIIQVIHSVNKYFETIDNNFRYTINLYNEYELNSSWNNTIKVINYLGVNQCINYKKIINKIKNVINTNKFIVENIAIIGRIDYHKFPTEFLDSLIKFCKIFNYKFNIYGNIEDYYKKYFLKKIQTTKNIIYHGYIDYENIENIYLNNDILLSPSKSEAGATVLLESMNNGLVPICRNSGGNKETINNEKYIMNDNTEYFHKIKNLSSTNYYEIIKDIFKMKKKIILYHNNYHNYNSLFNHINIYHETNIQKNIPNIIHYIYGLKKQEEEFPFIFFYSIFSNIIINKPDKIYFHYYNLPFGHWWNRIKKYLVLNFINYNELEFNNEKVNHYAHKSDYIRLLMLYKYGGIYYDIDTICIKSHNYLLDNEIVLGIQEKYKNNLDLIGNAIIMCKKQNTFIKKILLEYENHFDNSKWTEASLFLPSKLYQNLNDEEKNKIKLLNNKYFYYPNYNQEYLLFNSNDKINEELTTYHFCYNYNKRYIDNIKNIEYILNNNLFSKMMNYSYSLMIHDTIFKDYNNLKNINTKIIDILIIIDHDFEIMLKYILNNFHVFYNNIYIFIYKTDKINDTYLEIFEKIKYFKNINICYVELYENIEISLQIKISKFLVEEYFIHNNLKILLLNDENIDLEIIEEININEIGKFNKNNFIKNDFNIDLLDLCNLFMIKNLNH